MDTKRRKFIGLLGTAGILGMAGCTTEQDQMTEEPTTGVRDYSFNTIPADQAPYDAEIISADHQPEGSIEITIRGTVEVRNGCINIRLGSEPEMTSEDPVRVNAMIGTYTPTEEEGCTQAIKSIGYELIFTCNPIVQEISLAQAGLNSQVYELEVNQQTEN